MFGSEYNIDKKILTPTSIIWDIENINMPKDLKVSDVKNELLNLASTHNADVKEFVVIGSTKQFRENLTFEILENDIALKNIASTKKNAADMSILYHIMNLKDKNPPPYKFIIISGDSDFTELIHQLKESLYEVILVHLNSSKREFIKAATHSVLWTDLLKYHLFIEKDEVFSKTRTISDSSILSSSMDTIIDSTYDTDTCMIKFYTTGLFEYYRIPNNISIDVGDIVEVEEKLGSINSWNIGKVVKVFYDCIINNSDLSIRRIIKDSKFNLLIEQKKTLDDEISEICKEFNKSIISAEMRWDKKNITLIYIKIDINFNPLKVILNKVYKVPVITKYIMTCPKQKCINRYCKFHHTKV